MIWTRARTRRLSFSVRNARATDRDAVLLRVVRGGRVRWVDVTLACGAKADVRRSELLALLALGS
jgi:hypothetical protein